MKELIKTDADYANPETKKRWMLWWEQKKRALVFVEFDREKALASLEQGEAVITIWLDENMEEVFVL